MTIDAGIGEDVSNIERRTYGAFQPGACFRDAPAGAPRSASRWSRRTRATSILGAQEGQAGLIFVDGGHDEDTCRHDTALALRLVAPGGVIVWDDYTPSLARREARARRVVVQDLALRHYPRLGFVVHVNAARSTPVPAA